MNMEEDYMYVTTSYNKTIYKTKLSTLDKIINLHGGTTIGQSFGDAFKRSNTFSGLTQKFNFQQLSFESVNNDLRESLKTMANILIRELNNKLDSKIDSEIYSEFRNRYKLDRCKQSREEIERTSSAGAHGRLHIIKSPEKDESENIVSNSGKQISGELNDTPNEIDVIKLINKFSLNLAERAILFRYNEDIRNMSFDLTNFNKLLQGGFVDFDKELFKFVNEIKDILSTREAFIQHKIYCKKNDLVAKIKCMSKLPIDKNVNGTEEFMPFEPFIRMEYLDTNKFIDINVFIEQIVQTVDLQAVNLQRKSVCTKLVKLQKSICDGLDFIHTECNVLHGDLYDISMNTEVPLQLRNIMVSDGADGDNNLCIRFVDFGLSALASQFNDIDEFNTQCKDECSKVNTYFKTLLQTL